MVVYVNEKKRGRKKKYSEILGQFGVFNVLYIILKEAVLSLFFYSRSRYAHSLNIDDCDLIAFLKLVTIINKPKYIFSIGCPCFIPPSLAHGNNEIKLINLHGGIIPYQRGRFSPLKSLQRGDKYIGCSIHEISSDFDSGPLISQAFFEVKSTSKLGIYNKTLSLSRQLVEDFFNGKVHKVPEEILLELSKIHHSI